MNTIFYPWVNIPIGGKIGEDVMIPVNGQELTIQVLIGDKPSCCSRSLTICISEPKPLLRLVRELKEKCANQSCNFCCSRPTKNIGTVTLVSFTNNSDHLVTLQLSYN